MATVKEVDVVVIGAGIAGSSCAIQLASLGHHTILLDRQEFPRHKTCGEFMSPETKEMLDHLDIDLLEQSHSPSLIHSAKIYMPRGGVIQANLPGPAYGISRFTLDRLLHQKAINAGAEVVTKAVVTRIDQAQEQRYEVHIKQGRQETRYVAKAVIGAYGTKGPRHSHATKEKSSKDVYVGIKSHYKGIDLSSEVELYFCDGGYVGISPIENGLVNVAALLSLEVVQRYGKSVLDILNGIANTNSQLAKRLAEGASVPKTQVSVAPIRLSEHPQPWSEYPHVGDALLVIPPLCGDGMSIALRSAVLCSRCTDAYLRGSLSLVEWQSQYSREAHEEFEVLLKRARRIQNMAFAKTNWIYPSVVRLFPGLGRYLVKITRLTTMMPTKN
ncbi:flavin-dependent dehydrogenase [Paenibacillus shirakamiensis]|uniref:Flavin-dependent dehydrogenase n=1 Tax=Paenibacillus shirakamiensis TaxID=1265935 RepID=A0ABS4JEI9_9BACL|nr:NAD(P)/FAD-dependent oxidoreductase [Paenibacillus shirakamiensis]MBP2000121.1 flavin-dependent dehydrogenase [Paenibacillus shirakamiensis]